MDSLPDTLPQLPRERPRRHRTVSAKQFAYAWTQSWQDMQLGSKLQPDSITENQIGMIALGGVIGTGLFLGTATALRHAGPGGALIGYIIIGTVVLSVTKSLAHIVSCFPRSGGPVGLAHLYVDPALAFALGWNAWYNWTIILPAEIAAAGILLNVFLPKDWATDASSFSGKIRNLNLMWTTILVLSALAINCVGTRYYGRIETLFSFIKILTILSVLIIGVVLDLVKRPNGSSRLLFQLWHRPKLLGGFKAYRHTGSLGRFFGLWTVLLQACFSYFGTEVVAMAAAEVRNPTMSIRRAASTAWIRISFFYVGTVLVAGLLVGHDDPALAPDAGGKQNYAFTSPFVIALRNQKWYKGAYVMATLFVFAAFSAAVSDVFISSRLLFFLSKCGHAPKWCSSVWRVRKFNIGAVPYAGIAVAGAFATLAYLTGAEAKEAEQAFHWLSTMTSTASLCSWIGMMWTYIAWQHGLMNAKKLADGGDEYYLKFFERYDVHIPKIKWYRYLRAWYALIMCILILVFNGWAVFTVPGQWMVARTSGVPAPQDDPDIGPPIPTFVTSYLPVPLFVLLTFGYKLMSRTKLVTTEVMVQNMAFEWNDASRGETPPSQPDDQIGLLRFDPTGIVPWVLQTFALRTSSTSYARARL